MRRRPVARQFNEQTQEFAHAAAKAGNLFLMSFAEYSKHQEPPLECVQQKTVWCRFAIIGFRKMLQGKMNVSFGEVAARYELDLAKAAMGRWRQFGWAVHRPNLRPWPLFPSAFLTFLAG